MPRISVVIPAHNSEKTIVKTIDSVLKQSFTDFELIVINDGSQDKTCDIVSKINDSRIKVLSYPKAGANVSRNRGLALAQAEFVSFLDADDIWAPDKLASQIQALQSNINAKVAYSWTNYIDDEDKFLLTGTHITAIGDVYEQLLITNFLESGSNPLICKDAILTLGGFDESLTAAQDWDMWLRLANKYNFVCVPKPQILYRIRANSLSSNLARQEKVCLDVLSKAYKIRPNTNQQVINLSLAKLYNYLTCRALYQPHNRQKGLLAASFLLKNFIYDSSRVKRLKLTLKLVFKISVIILFPSALSTAILTTIKGAKTPTNDLETTGTL
ncbi:probable glycosyl transferase [Rivularia sp. IAM M-261]|nr:probable glycosyl transferase [Rivularia sp. IAM M-261]